MSRHEIRFQANPIQKRFIESRAEADCFSSRKGEGKSAALAWSIFYHTMNNPGANWVVIRDTWENLRRTTQKEFFHWFPPGVIGEYKAGNKEFEWRAEAIGVKGTVTFIGVDDETDASKIASMPLAGVAMDEPSPAAGDSGGISEFVFDTAMGQLRQSGMNWYAAKLAQNNPDEDHWTYRRFVDPGTEPTPQHLLPEKQQSGFLHWQTQEPENVANLPTGYYERMMRQWADRPDLLRRFVEGKFGFQQIGRAVTPEWDDMLHLTAGLKPVKGADLHLLWDGGLNPTCVVTQVTPLGDWLVLEAHTGDGIGAYELITDVVKPALASRYEGYTFRHIGDPSMRNREQSSSAQSAALLIQRELGGPFVPGPIAETARVEPLRAVMRRVREGRGIMRVDKDKAKAVWHALRGGWRYHVARSGVVGNIDKNDHSHPGDAMGYGAAVLFPLGRLRDSAARGKSPRAAQYFHGAPGGLGFEKPGASLPSEARTLGEKT